MSTLDTLLNRNSHPRLTEPGPDADQLQTILQADGVHIAPSSSVGGDSPVASPAPAAKPRGRTRNSDAPGTGGEGAARSSGREPPGTSRRASCRLR